MKYKKLGLDTVSEEIVLPQAYKLSTELIGHQAMVEDLILTLLEVFGRSTDRL